MQLNVSDSIRPDSEHGQDLKYTSGSLFNSRFLKMAGQGVIAEIGQFQAAKVTEDRSVGG